MVYLRPYLRLVLIGTLYDVEDFSFSLNFISDDSATPAPPTVPSGVINACTTYFANNAAPISQNAKLQVIKLNLIGVDGRYTADETVQHELIPPVPGGSSSNVAPQLALAVSTATAVTRGRASKGRWYLPIPGAPIEPTGVLSTPYQSSALSAATQFVQACNTALAPWHAGVVSDAGTGAQRTITHLRVGRVMDTMRSRRDKFEESYAEGGPITVGSAF